MVPVGNGEEPNYDAASSLLFTEETTFGKSEQLNTSTETLTSSQLHAPPPPTLPFDLVIEVLCRLPVRLLLKLQCLCKSWKSLISDPKFAKKNLHMATKRHHLIVSSTNSVDEILFFDSPIPSVLSTCVTQTQLSYPISLRNTKPLAMCSCDGIICITLFNNSALLWNPSIQKFKMLPPLKSNQQKSVLDISYSFGYDHFIDSYKIVSNSYLVNNNEVSVYTLGVDNWRRIQDIPYTCVSTSGVFVSGTVNWLAYDPLSHSSSRAIVSLDLDKETYQEISQPDLVKDRWTLGVLNDSLCIFASSYMFLDVWIMKEYGNKDSWTKLYNIPYIDRGSYTYAKVLYISEDDQMLMDVYDLGINKLKLVVYDSKNGIFYIPEIQNTNCWINPKVYVESLISPCL